VGMEVVVPVWISSYEYRNCVWVIFGCKSCPMKGLLGVILCMGMGIPIPYPFVLEGCPYGPKYFIYGKWGG
jgi:hypothetical protein